MMVSCLTCPLQTYEQVIPVGFGLKFPSMLLLCLVMVRAGVDLETAGSVTTETSVITGTAHNESTPLKLSLLGLLLS